MIRTNRGDSRTYNYLKSQYLDLKKPTNDYTNTPDVGKRIRQYMKRKIDAYRTEQIISDLEKINMDSRTLKKEGWYPLVNFGAYNYESRIDDEVF